MILEWNHSILCVLWDSFWRIMLHFLTPAESIHVCVDWMHVLFVVLQPEPAVGAATVQRSEWCNEKDAGIKRWIRGESKPHRDTDVVITPRLMTQHSASHTCTHIHGMCLTFTEQTVLQCMPRHAPKQSCTDGFMFPHSAGNPKIKTHKSELLLFFSSAKQHY